MKTGEFYFGTFGDFYFGIDTTCFGGTRNGRSRPPWRPSLRNSFPPWAMSGCRTEGGGWSETAIRPSIGFRRGPARWSWRCRRRAADPARWSLFIPRWRDCSCAGPRAWAPRFPSCTCASFDGNMRAAVSALVGEGAARGLSPSVISRLKRAWWDEYRTWKERPLDDDWVCLWADGIHSGLRGDGGRLCARVVIGAIARGKSISRRERTVSGNQRKAVASCCRI